MSTKLSKLVDIRKIVPLNVKPREVLEKPLLLMGFEITEGDFGVFASMRCVGEKTGELLNVSSGESSIVSILQALPNPLEEPIAFQFKREGRTTVMTD